MPTSSPEIDFFLSEMAVSNSHGGGLTLQQTLQDDIDRIASYFHVGTFACTYPPVERVAGRSRTFQVWTDRKEFQRVLSRRISGRMSCQQWFVNLYWCAVAGQIRA